MVTVGSVVGGGFALLKTQWRAALIWGLIYAAVSAAMSLAMRPMFEPMMGQAMTVDGATVDPNVMAAAMGQFFLIYVVLMFLMLVLYAAALRGALHPEESAFAFLRVGMDEVRLLGLAVVLGIASLVVMVALMLVLGIVAAIVAVVTGAGTGTEQGGVAAVVLTFATIVAIYGAAIYVQVRLSLAFPLTMLRRRITIGESWRLTKGRFWTLFGIYLVIGLIFVVASIAILPIFMGSYLGDIAASGYTEEGLARAAQLQLARQFNGLTPLAMATSMIGGAFGTAWFALAAGASAAATTGLLADRQIAEAINGTDQVHPKRSD